MVIALNPPRIQSLTPLSVGWPVLAGLLTLYAPTYFDLATVEWKRPEYAHGLIVVLVAVGLFWRNRMALMEASRPRGLAGGLLLGFGLLMYVLGRSQDILLLEVGSQIPVLGGLLLLFKGPQVLRVLWFPLAFLVFMLPLPSFIVDGLTGPLKHAIAVLVEHGLYELGYPIARNGVVLDIGPYQLFIADACSGLNSMFALTALGTLFIYCRGRTSTLHNAILLGSILPIAFIANTVRVIGLVLITYYWGDAAGQGYLHDAAGFTEFVIALFAFFALDGLLARALYKRGRIP